MYLCIHIICACINISQIFSSKKWQLHLFSWVRALTGLEAFYVLASLVISTTRQEYNYCRVSKKLVAHKVHSLAQTGTVGG